MGTVANTLNQKKLDKFFVMLDVAYLLAPGLQTRKQFVDEWKHGDLVWPNEIMELWLKAREEPRK